MESNEVTNVLLKALHEISLVSQNSMGSREECGRIAREAIRNAMQKPQNDANKTLRDLSARMAMSGHERIDRNGNYRTPYDEGYSDAMFRAASWVDVATKEE